MINISIKPREFSPLQDKCAWTEIQKDAGYWQNFYKTYPRQNSRVRHKAPDMRKDRRYVGDIFRATTEQLKLEQQLRG